MKVITPVTITDTMVTGGTTWSRGSPATYYDYNGILQTASTGVPRMTYTPSTKAFLGLLVEGAATNLLSRSNGFDQSAWTKNNSTISITAGTAPTNATEALKLFENASNTIHSVAQAATVVSGSTYCFSVYAKAAERSWICMELTKSGTTPDAWFDLTTGVVGGTTTGVVSRGIEAIGNNWYRCTMTVVADTTTTTASIYTSTANNVVSYAGSTTSGVLLYGAQLELNAVSSYIATTTTTVTRAADTPGVYNGLPENDYPAWSSASVSYTANQRVILASTHKIYSCVTAHTSTVSNGPADSVTLWAEVSPTNRWAMFDNTSQTYSTNPNEILLVLSPGNISSLALAGLQGLRAEISVIDTAAGNANMYRTSLGLDNSSVSNWYDYFYADYLQQEYVIIGGSIPPISTNLVAVRVIGTTAAIGSLSVGYIKYLGSTQLGFNMGIIDYSRKETNSFGVTNFVQRAYSKRTSVKLMIENSEINAVYSKLASLRATPAIWITTDDPRYDPTVIYGFYKDFSIDVPYNQYSYCSLEIEGLT